MTNIQPKVGRNVDRRLTILFAGKLEDMVNKTLTMIKGALPNRFYSICQGDRMSRSSGT
jgi:hypothetical protein